MSLATGLLKQAYMNIFKDEISQIPLIVKKNVRNNTRG